MWRARHRQLHRDVAVKQLAIGDSAEYHARFRREARLLAQIDHPHVVRLFDYRESEGVQLLVMELLSGGTLADRRDAGMSQATAVAATLAAATGLHHVHCRGVLHRDVKPENLMFDGSGTLKVTDFGVARGDLVDATVIAMTHAGAFFGTPAYAAPEQCAHAIGEEGPDIDAAADQYSLAAVLYEALAHRLTHDPSGGAAALCRRRVEQDALPLPDTVPSAIARTIARALARDPTSRFSSVANFGTELTLAATDSWGEGWPADAEVQLRDTGSLLAAVAASSAPAEQAPRRRRRSRLLIGGAVLAIVVIAVAAGLRSRGSDGGAAGTSAGAGSTRQLVRRWTVPTGGPVFSSPAVTDGLVIFGSDDGSVRAVDSTTGALRWRYRTGAPVRSSPAVVDGRIFVGSNDGYLYAFDLRGAVLWKRSLGYEIVSSPAVSGSTVVVGAAKLSAFDVATGNQRWAFSPDDVIVSSPAIAHGTVVVGSNDHNVYAVTLENGRELWRLRTAAAVQSSPTIANGMAYVGGVDGFAYAIDVTSGRDVWATDLGAPVKSSPVEVGGTRHRGNRVRKPRRVRGQDRRTGMGVPHRRSRRFVAPRP